MEKPNSIPEGVRPTHLRRALRKENAYQRRTEKLEYRMKIERSKQNGIDSIKNTDEEDRRVQREGTRWLKDHIRSKQPMLALKDQLGLHAYFSMNLAKRARPDVYDLGIDAQKIIELYDLRLHHEYEAEDAHREELRKQRMEREQEQEQERVDAEMKD